VRNSHYDYDAVLINGENIISIGALFDEDFDEWLANDKFLDVNERLSQEGDYYAINDISDFKQLLAFGQDASLKFRLENDLDLAGEPDFYIPYLAGEFDGAGHNISNLSFSFDFVSGVGLFGYLASPAGVSHTGAVNVNIMACEYVGGLVGVSDESTVSNSYSTGNVIGFGMVGGLVGYNFCGTVSNCSFVGNVTGSKMVGGLVGVNDEGYVSNCSSVGDATGSDCYVGGLVGDNDEGRIANSYSAGSVTGGGDYVGGLTGSNGYGHVSNSYSTSNVAGSEMVGGLVGVNGGTVIKSYSTGTVTGGEYYVGGLTGSSYGGTVSNSFWDTETSGQLTSAGGEGKTTAEMHDFSTFSAIWDIVMVAGPGERDTGYIWNIVDDVTYPFLSWQPVA
jgi:hypothetical protein